MVSQCIHDVKFWLKKYEEQNSSETLESGASKRMNTSCAPTCKMKLAKTDLRKFSGDVLDWPEFWEIFRVTVHQNPETPQVQKFVYLKSLLTGEAAGYVSNIKTEGANYDVAVQLLQLRYGKIEVQRNRLMIKLAYLKPVEQSNKAMRDAVDFLQRCEHFRYKVLPPNNMAPFLCP